MQPKDVPNVEISMRIRRPSVSTNIVEVYEPKICTAPIIIVLVLTSSTDPDALNISDI